MPVLVLSPHHVQTIEQEAAKSFPDECCGLLIGKGADTITVTDVVPSANLAESSDSFLVDPQLQFDWIRKVRGTDRRIVGPYHSHPNGRAEPSQHDADMALEPGQIWVIVPTVDGSPSDLKAYEVTADTGAFKPVTIRIS